MMKVFVFNLIKMVTIALNLKKAYIIQSIFAIKKNTVNRIIIFGVEFKLKTIDALFDTIEADSITGYINNQPLNFLNYNKVYEKINSCKGFPKSIDISNSCLIPIKMAQFKKPKLNLGQSIR